MRTTHSLLLILTAILSALTHPVLGAAAAWQDESRDVFDEAPVLIAPEARAAQEAKNRRYDEGGRDLTAPVTVNDDGEREQFIEQSWPRVDLSDSALVVVGTVSSRQPYLSHDKSRIYTAFVVRVEDVLEADQDVDLSAGTVTMDRLGGALRLASGSIVRDDIQLCGLGWPEVGRRYVLFARKIHGGKDLEYFYGYRLQDGKVSLIAPSPGGSTLPASLSTEASLLDALRRRSAIEHSAPRRRSIED